MQPKQEESLFSQVTAEQPEQLSREREAADGGGREGEEGE